MRQLGTITLLVLSCAALLAAMGAPSARPAAAQAGPDPATIRVSAERVVMGLQRPVGIANAGDGSGRLFVVEKVGRVRILRDGRLEPRAFLDITDRVQSGSNEQGLLGIAFHPDYAENGSFFVNYTSSRPIAGLGNGDTVVARFQVTADPDRADPDSGTFVIGYDQPYPNHNGGHLAFGPDGKLYIGSGDGGSGGDPQNRAQNKLELLGKMLRIDVDNGDPYSVPDDNPFVGQRDAAPEIWAIGLRNPWRYSFDAATGDLYIGDVGQGAIEEINFQAAASAGGENYGWRIMEGDQCFNPRNNCDRSGLTLPVATYSHALGLSVTGGEVYRGTRYPNLVGAYFYADYQSGRVWALSRDGAGAWRYAEVGNFGQGITSFGLDEAGEIHVALDRGEIRRLVDDNAGAVSPTPSATMIGASPTPTRTAMEPTPTEQATATRTPTDEPVPPSPSPTQSPLVQPGATVQRLATGYAFTEGPAADSAGRVYFSDVQNSRIHLWSAGTGAITLHRENTGRSNGLYFDPRGRLVVCEMANQRLTRDDLAGTVSVAVDAYDGKPFNAPNDLWVDARGGVYFSDPAYGLQPGSLPQDGEHVYYLPADGRPVMRVAGDLVRPNGLIGTPDGESLYITDAGDGRTWRYRVQADGTLSAKTPFVAYGGDGMSLDEQGNVYLATDKVRVFNPAGAEIAGFEIPERPSNMTFAGGDRRTLFITARTSVYTLAMAVRGAPSWNAIEHPRVLLPALLREATWNAP